jgi:hypothetical protein
VATQEGAPPEAGHEAQVLALALVGHRQPGVACERAHRVLRQASQGEAEPIELGGVELGQHVALILARVVGRSDQQAVIVAGDARVVAGREPSSAEPVRELEHRVEADGSVAAHAGVRREAGGVAADEAVDDLGAETVAQVEGHVRDAHPVGKRAGAGDRLRRAAGALAVGGRVGPELQRDREHLVAGVQRELCGGGAVDSSAHRDERAAWPGLDPRGAGEGGGAECAV